ncbi:MAG: hypothetical protein D6685_02085 [Bacteroidetes bacterium]|nr:hypothetical protein AWN76_009015 [Rhodothermaceae bacterium RA]RMH68507.1 MAG: hypothetical protein D6685_02085 [Bacteroidota bacterium]
MSLLTHTDAAWSTPRLIAWFGGLMTLAAVLGPVGEAAAQRPFRVYDPFYQGETARRTFFDGYALTAEISYRAAGTVQNDGLSRANPDPLGLSLRFDYQLSSQIDLSAIVDASAGNTGRTLSVSWLVLKYYDCVENEDCIAVRLAVDPSSDGRVGFPQLDLAFISTSYLSPVFSNDFVLGVRRVRMGYEQWVPRDVTAPTLPSGTADEGSRFDVRYTRALGAELNLALGYNVHFDPAGSNVFLVFQAQGGQYELVETDLRADEEAAGKAGEGDETGAAGPAASMTSAYRGGALWLRTGLEFNRPSYRLSPFLGLPVQQWMPRNTGGQRARLQLGFRFTLR